MEKVIIDSGPLVALVDQAEEHHGWSKESVARLRPPLLTCEAVLSEACFLLERVPQAYSHLAALIKRDLIIPVSMQSSYQKVFGLMESYRNVPMSFADACLVCMVEQNSGASIFTLDRDFAIYRQQRRRMIPLIAPF